MAYFDAQKIIQHPQYAMSQDAIFSKLVSSTVTKHIHHSKVLFLYIHDMHDSKLKAKK